MNPPLLSIITPVFDTDPAALDNCLESVRTQSFAEWEHCLVDDASPTEETLRRLALAASRDQRVRLLARASNGGIVVASNDALAMATGEFVVLLDHDDLLTPGALASVAKALLADPAIDYLYTDEDHLTPAGTTFHSTYKPDWSPERFRSHMYTCHLSVIRRSLVAEVGGFRPAFEGSQDYDLVLRVTERARRISHLPIVGYHWRMGPGSTAANPAAKPYAHAAGLRAVQDHCDRVGIDAVVEMIDLPGHPGFHRLIRKVRGNPTVDAVIVTKGETGRVWGAPRLFVADAVESLAKRGGYPVATLRVATPQPLPEDAATWLRAAPGLEPRVITAPCDSRAELLNRAAAGSRAEFLLLLHDDVEVLTDGLLELMVAMAEASDVGMVGCRAVASDGTLDHAGHVYMGRPGLAYHGRGADEMGWNGLLVVDREVSGVSAICALVRREVFERVGGFSPQFPGDDRDVDLSLKIRRLGFRILYTPHATVRHFRATDVASDATERSLLFERWRSELENDPYHHRKLLRGRDDWAVPFGPDA
jgi:GT2 family glycosyltransferase